MGKRWIFVFLAVVFAFAVAVFLVLQNKTHSFVAFSEGEDIKTDFLDNNWLFSPVQGIIKSYEKTPEGVVYINLQYYRAGKPATVKVLLGIPKNNSTIYLSEAVVEQTRQKAYSRKNYIDYVQVITASGETEKRMMAVDEFQKVYRPGVFAVKVLAVKEYPEIGLRDDNFCQRRGYFLCMVADLADVFGGDLAAFWRQGGSPYDGFLIPYYFSMDVKFNE